MKTSNTVVYSMESLIAFDITILKIYLLSYISFSAQGSRAQRDKLVS